MSIRVAIVEDLDEIRNGLAYLIGASDGFDCVATFTNAEDALRDLPDLRPDTVLMDVGLPGMSGISCIRELKQNVPEIQFMMLTVFEDDETIFQSLQAGATGYILKKTPPSKILESLKDLHAGGSPMSGEIARKVVQAFQKMGQSHKEVENLTAREHEILSYLAKGYRYKEIAEALFVSVETVRTHIRNIYEKLQVRSRTEALLKARLA